MYACQQLIVVATRKIGPPDAGVEKSIPCEDYALSPEAYAAWAMARGMQDQKAQVAELEVVPTLQEPIRFDWL